MSTVNLVVLPVGILDDADQSQEGWNGRGLVVIELSKESGERDRVRKARTEIYSSKTQ
jgi:hypothetical protein